VVGLARYTSLRDVERDVEAGVFRNESELRQAFVEALKEELRTACRSRGGLVDYYLIPALDRPVKNGRPDIRVANLVFEVEPPRAGLEMGREQLHEYLGKLRDVSEYVKLHGVVLDGLNAEYWVMESGRLELVRHGGMADVVRSAIRVFCSEKIPVVQPEDLAEIFGV
jgi:hypothetical protein